MMSKQPAGGEKFEINSFLEESISSTSPGESVSRKPPSSVTLPDFHFVGVSEPSQSVSRPRDVIFSKHCDQKVSDIY